MMKYWWAVVLAGMLVVSPVYAVVYDLSADWSDSQNPFGPWSLMKSPTQLFTVNQPDYNRDGGFQRAWADEPYWIRGYIPVWYKPSNPAYTFINVHGAEIDQTGTNETSVVWTSPETASIKISGALWDSGAWYRTMGWQLRKNDKILSQGSIYSTGTYTMLNPLSLAAGSGGPDVLEQNVKAGDKISLALISLSENGNLGNMLSIKFRIETPPRVARTTVGIGCRSVRDKIMLTASQNFLFRLWGKAKVEGPGSFTIDDGSGAQVRVIAPGYTGIKDGDLVSARGVLDPTAVPPTLTCEAGDVARVGALPQAPPMALPLEPARK